jgi:phage terminase large subunit GpA-like protein
MTATIDLPSRSLVDSFSWCLDLSRAPSVRPISEWAEEVIKLPNGPMAGERYRHHRHPVSRPFFAELDSGRWSRVAATGPVQNGKTLMCYVIPVLYHLFEMKETVIVGLPSMDMANDKWSEDFLPVIMSSGYGRYLPTSGEGSRGGQVKRAIHFTHGPTMRYMTAGGNDKKRSAYTSRVVAITETDGMDESSESSREADKIEQIEARTEAFGRTGKRVYLECTASIARGRIWQEITNGSNAKLLRPCPHCGDWVAPEREHLKGWQEATTSEQAAKVSFFACPACDEPWTEDDRREAAKSIVICHAGQSVDDCGNLVGPYPETQTFGFRWSAIDNPFASMGDLGAKEWLASKARDQENAEKKCRQFIWALPYDPPDIELTPLDPEEIAQRTGAEKKGIVPDGAKVITIGIDTGKRVLHWSAIASGESGSRIIEYGKQPVDSDKLGVKQGLIKALRELAEYFTNGWPTEGGKLLTASQVWIDSGWHEHTDAVYEFCGEINQAMGLAVGAEVYRPTKGYGEGQRRMTRYIAPDAKRKGTMYLGSEFHISKVKRNGRTVPGVMLVHMNADHWKSELHQRLLMPADEPLSVTLYQAASFAEHSEFCKHLTAEKQVEKFVEGRGEIVVWERTDRNNHWLDATYSAVCAGEAMLIHSQRKTRSAAEGRKPLKELARQ